MGLFDIFTKKAKEREQQRIEEEHRINACLWDLVSKRRWEEALNFVSQNYKDESVRVQLTKAIKEKRLAITVAEHNARLAKEAAARAERKRLRQEKIDKHNEMISNLEYVEIAVEPKPSKSLPLYLLDEITFSMLGKGEIENPLGNFIAVDVETTGLTPSKDEIVEISAVCFRDFIPTRCFTSLLHPKKGINEEAQRINKITAEMVEGKPTFSQVAKSFLDFIGDDPLVGHNLEFDLRFIVKHGADVTSVERNYYDTLALARKLIKKNRTVWDKEMECYMPDPGGKGVDNYKLSTICTRYGIIISSQHRATADAVATGFLFKKLVELKKKKLEESAKNSRVSDVDYPKKDTLNPNHPLYGKNIVFTGTLSIDRHTAMQKAANVGAIIRSAVSKKTNILVVGKQDNKLVGDDGLSEKQETAYKLNSLENAHIKIIKEETFLKMLFWGNANDMPQV